MKNHKTIGDYYATLLKKHLNEAIQKKLDDTSAFKKKLAGINSVDDAKRKGYAPSDAQINQIRACVKTHANLKYEHEHFRHMSSEKAIHEFLHDVKKELATLNEQWRSERLFAFDKAALDELATEATHLIAGEHDTAKGHFFT